ncbi:DUF479 domain-containing protein [Exilibacterium tricleocarpae]|uniref:DUF479 domain-containing protein n=1 Tax=Exilibacterium tricleocarpae TaxID=2591008 RepID=A0A545TZ69_9GAMM|nr:ACP phosphodiesterase [Exilibacterium tricleocarpae]TQV82519.1 DUF479 domain-containing protein [Exilibacterium tricleocarpae]
MNYLAHQLLSGPSRDLRIGGFLGDFVKGPLRGKYPAAIERGIALHRRIDVFSDHHALVKRSIARLGPDMRRVGGIAIDLCYDHFLARHWHDYHRQPLADYCAEAYGLWSDYEAVMPPPALRFYQRARQYDLLHSYRDRDNLQRTLFYVARRLSRATPLAESYPRIHREYRQLQGDFVEFFPQLLAFADNTRRGLASADPN